MQANSNRPNPDDLLAILLEQEKRKARGRLKVFLGMCPGVGKTYAMLKAAHAELASGVAVLVGVVETHGRAETAALLVGLEVVPPRTIEYRGTRLQEMDLDQLIKRRPHTAVVDELAHSNAPGSSHAKRWQDVVELLDQGIDVLTTLNIQHVESRAEAVRQIVGVAVAETVPDSIFDLADEVELVDLTPEALRLRLQEGKVYLGARAGTAAENFFKESNLNALREIALRFTAERVDRQLRTLRRSVGTSVVWRSGERLLVAVGGSPFSTQLVRWTRRLAAAQGAPWIAVHVEGSAQLKPSAQRLLDQNLSLARELGAEIVMTHGDDIAKTLVRVALEHNATQIVVGKPRGNHWLDWLRGGSLVDRLIQLGGNIDIYVVPAETTARRRSWLEFEPPPRSELKEYAEAIGVVVALTMAGLLLPAAYYLATGLVFLLGVLALSLRVGRWPVLVAGVLSASSWNYLFIPPRFTWQINQVEDVTLFFTYFAVALISGQLTARVRAQAVNERQRERRATALFHLTRAMAEARNLDEAVAEALRQVDELFEAKSALLLVAPSEPIKLHPASSWVLDERETGVAQWALQNRKVAGRFTDTLPSSHGYYIPLFKENKALGVLGVGVEEGRELTLAQRDLLDAFSRPLTLVIEREELQRAKERERLLAESEKLHRALLDSVSHELRTPLAVITGAVENLGEVADDQLRGELLAEARRATARLNRLVSNLLDQTRLESGALRPRMDWCDARDLVNAALDGVSDSIGDRPVEISIADDLPPVQADFALTEQALANLLVNASLHTPVGTPIFIAAGLDLGGTRAYLTVADRGPGFPAAMRSRLFQKFTRGDAARAGGLGLGLSIVRGFVVAQGGEVVVGENPGGGAVFTIYLPHQAPQLEGLE